MNRAPPWTSMSGGACSNLGYARDMNGNVPISTADSSGLSIGVSSLVNDANSSLSGGAQLQPSTSMDGDSLMRVPASPMSFSSNNISGSSVIDGSIMQQSPPLEQVQKCSSSSVTSQPVIDAGGALHAQKKSRIDVSQADIIQQLLIQLLLRGQNSLHFQGQQNPQLQALIQQLAGTVNPESLAEFAEIAEKCLAEFGSDPISMGDVLSNILELQLQDANPPEGPQQDGDQDGAAVVPAASASAGGVPDVSTAAAGELFQHLADMER